MPAVPVKDVPRYLAKSIALFEAIDDELLSIKPLGIQVMGYRGGNATISVRLLSFGLSAPFKAPQHRAHIWYIFVCRMKKQITSVEFS